MRFSPHILDEIRARLPVSQVVSRKVALKKKGREFAGLSPFKTEKTPSFFVNDHKAFYHCFASGEHGDIFTFLMKTEGLSFPEAVERLAEEAGVVLPKAAPEDRQREAERDRLYRLLSVSAKYFSDMLIGAAGRDARRYLQDRGLDDKTIAQFDLGFAPDSRNALTDVLTGEGFSQDEIVKSGMRIAGADIREPYDRFRGRVMFPIRDTKGRVIAFGGRALDPNVPAKYLNSPETPLFQKGRVLFNAANARKAGYDKGRILVVEGYMDVVALTQAGFEEAVAPLGTALTQDQIQLLWRVTPEPILCFDGDSAGRKAADRAAETVLPHIAPGQSLTFAFLPDGLDPDDLVRQHGAGAFETLLNRAKPLCDVLFNRVWDSGEWTTPERRARLETHLKEFVSRIQNQTVRTYYDREMRNRTYQSLRRQQQHGTSSRVDDPANRRPPTTRWPNRTERFSDRSYFGARQSLAGRDWKNTKSASVNRQATPAEATDGLRTSGVAGISAFPPREVLLLRTALNHPWLIERYAEDISTLELTSETLDDLRNAMLSAHALQNSLDRTALRSQLNKLRVEKIVDMVERAATHRSDRFAEPDAESAEVEIGWRHTLALHRLQQLDHALRAAESAWNEDANEEALARIQQIQAEYARLKEMGSEAPAVPTGSSEMGTMSDQKLEG